MAARLNWNDVPVLLAIAEAGGLAGAARTLGVNHSTVFRRLEAAEHALGVALFERDRGGYRPTQAGRELLPDAELARDAVHRLQRHAEGRDATPRGTVRLTAPADLAQRIVPRALVLLQTRYPDVRVDLSVSDSDLNLTRREADLALRATATPPEDLVGRRLCEIDWWFWGRERVPVTSATPMVVAGSALSRIDAYRALAERTPSSAVCATADTLDAMAALARAGVGCAMLPSVHGGDGLVRVERFEAAPTSLLWILFHPDLRNVARVRAVADVLQEAVSEIAGSG